MARLRTPAPGMELEREAAAADLLLAGLDEVGRGAWAGPLTVGVVIAGPGRLSGVRDSKLLSHARRAALVPRITAWARGVAVGEASAGECDRLGMSEAQRLAAARALDALGLQPDVTAVDGRWDFVGGARTLVGGERRSLTIAAASIVAKEHRDAHMRALHPSLPWYDFGANKGYPSPAHRAALQAFGPSTEHRTSWGWTTDLPWAGGHRGAESRPRGRSGHA